MNKTRETSTQRSILVLFLMLVLLSVPGWAQQEASILGQDVKAAAERAAAEMKKIMDATE